MRSRWASVTRLPARPARADGSAIAFGLRGAASSAIPPPYRGRSATPDWSGGSRVGVHSRPRWSRNAGDTGRTPTRQHLLRSEANAVDLPRPSRIYPTSAHYNDELG